jgi:hypothetical protein
VPIAQSCPWIAAGVTFNGYRRIQLKYDAKDGVLKSIFALERLITRPFQKVMHVIPFSPPTRKPIPHIAVPSTLD